MNLHNPTKRVLDILNIVSNYRDGLSLTEISNLIDYPKSTLSPILKTLLKEDFLVQEKDSSLYKIGLSSFLVGASYVSASSGMQEIENKLKEIIEVCNEVCNIGILDNNEVFYLIKVSGDESLRLMSAIGKRLPIYATALGKALVSDKTYDELKEMLPENFKTFTSNTITNIDDLYANIQKYKENDLFFEDEEITEFAGCIATPLRKRGKIIGALSVSFAKFRTDENKIRIIQSLLKDYSVIIERLMDIYEINTFH